MSIRLFYNKSVQNAGWIIAGRIVQMIAAFFVGILSARYLGPSNYGLINYATAYTSFFSAFCTLGINSVIVKELINNEQAEGTVLGTSIVLKAVSSFLSSLMIVGIVAILDYGEPITIAVAALCSLGVIFNVLETFNYWFQSKLQSRISALATLVGYLVVSAYKIILMALKKNILYFAVSTSLDYLVVGILLIAFYFKYGGQRIKFSWEYGKILLKSSSHFILPALMVSIYAQTDKMMLKQLISDAENGYYSTAVSLCSAWCFILSAIIESMNPAIIEDYKNGNTNGFREKNILLYTLVFYISIIVSLLYCVAASPLVSVLYGEAYLPSIQPLRIITWYTAFSYLGVARNSWIVCENKQKYLIWIYISAAISNVILNLILIPLWGASGAALASLIAQFITTMVTPFFIKEIRPNVKMMIDGIMLKGLKKYISKKIL